MRDAHLEKQVTVNLHLLQLAGHSLPGRRSYRPLVFITAWKIPGSLFWKRASYMSVLAMQGDHAGSKYGSTCTAHPPSHLEVLT